MATDWAGEVTHEVWEFTQTGAPLRKAVSFPIPEEQALHIARTWTKESRARHEVESLGPVKPGPYTVFHAVRVTFKREVVEP